MLHSLIVRLVIHASSIIEFASIEMPKARLGAMSRLMRTHASLRAIGGTLPQVAALDMNESILDADQVENLIKFCPTKEKMELLKINKRPSWYCKQPLVIATCDSRSSSRFSSDRRWSPPLRYSRSPCLPGPHLVAIPDHHLPAVITLLHPEEGTTQGAQVASLLMDKGVEAVVLDVACLIEWLLCYFHWFMLSSKSKEW
ncbi:hypothetical protein Tco_0260811 [Tanacetum coccineum]